MAPEVVGSNPIFHPAKWNIAAKAAMFFYARTSLQACLQRDRTGIKRLRSNLPPFGCRAPAASGLGMAEPQSHGSPRGERTGNGGAIGKVLKNSLDLYTMKDVFNFLAELQQNNNREWFNENKGKYLAIREKFEAFAGQLIERISGWDEDIASSQLGVKDCTYRIYRDTRFSKNKEPYKTHMGIFICKEGKKSPYAGYYLHLEPPAQYIHPDTGVGPDSSEKEVKLPDKGVVPEQKGVHTQTPLSMGGCFIIAGTYRYESKVLRSIRDEISVNGDSFLEAMEQAEGFCPEESDMLRKVPAEFASAPERWHRLLKYRTFALIKPVDTDYIIRDGALDRIADDFKRCSAYLKKLNMAIEYAYEED